MGTPTNATESMLASRNHPQRVPAAALRRLFFFADPTKDYEPTPENDYIDDQVATIKTKAHLSDVAIELLERANPFVREKAFMDMACAEADEVVCCIDLCFTTFERSVFHLMADNAALFRRMVAPLIGRLVCPMDKEKTLDYWQGVPMPTGAQPRVNCDLADQLVENHLVLWAIVMWRVTTGLLLDRGLDLHPLDDGIAASRATKDEVISYNMHLYRDTHLNQLTHMTQAKRYSDEFFIDEALRSQHYPHATQVLCIEELPKMADALSLANIWYDSGIRKTRGSALEAIVHATICKSLNHKCQMRDLSKLVLDYADEFLAFNRLFKLTLQCAMLGNLPRAEARPWMAARIRINASFLYEKDGPSTPLRKGPIREWMEHSLYPLMFFLREMIIYTIESEVVLNNIMNKNYHWLQHKRITRTCNGDVRRVLSHQAAKNPGIPFDWSQFQRTVLNRNGNDKKVGLAMKYHDAGLKSISKMRKGSWQVIMLKEYTSCNTRYGSEIIFDNEACVAALEEISDAMHFAAWVTAKNGKPIMETAHLQFLGMSEAGFSRVRRLIFEYHIFDVSDNGFVDEIFELYRHRPMDYLILRCFLLLDQHYSNEKLFFLPIDRVNNQFFGMRKRFGIEDHFDTPELLGKSYMCDRCESWANPVSVPPYVTQHGRMLKAAPGGRATLQHTHEEEEEEGGDQEEDEEEEDDEEEEVSDTDAMRNDQEKRRNDTEDRKKKKVIQSTYMSNAWYDPVSHKLSCRRKHPAEYNPMEDIYDEIDALVADEANEDEDTRHRKSGTATRKQKKQGNPESKGLLDAGKATANKEEEEEEEEEDDAVFKLLDTLDFEASATGLNFRQLEKFAEQAVALGDSSEEEHPVEADKEEPKRKRPQRRVDPVDTYLMHYFKRNNGGTLKKVDPVGVWIKTKKGVYGYCDEPGCGAMTQIENNRVTNRGISCLHHVTSNMAITNPIRIILEQRQWKKMRMHPGPGPLRPPPSILAAVARGERVSGINVLKRLQPVRNEHGVVLKCFYCRSYDAEHQFIVYDKLVRLCRIPLCDVDHSHVLRSVPTGTIPSAQKFIDALARPSSGFHAAGGAATRDFYIV